MNIEMIKEKTRDIVLEIYDKKGYEIVNLDYIGLFDELNLDSLSIITLIVEIETRFDIEIPDNLLLMENFININSIANIIEEQLLKQK